MSGFLLRAISLLLAAVALAAAVRFGEAVRFLAGSTRLSGRVVRAFSSDSYEWQYTARFTTGGIVRFIDVTEGPPLRDWRAEQRYRPGDVIDVYVNGQADPPVRFGFEVRGDLAFGVVTASMAGIAVVLWRAAGLPRASAARVRAGPLSLQARDALYVVFVATVVVSVVLFLLFLAVRLIARG